MFSKVNVPLLGLIENMAWFECDLGTRYHIFGEGGGQREAKRLKIPMLGQIPLNINTREQADGGTPVALLNADKDSASAAFSRAATAVTEVVAHLEKVT